VKVHLAYCTNVHPAEDLPGIVAQLDRFAVPVREELNVDVLGLGLWLAAPVAAELAADRDLCRKFKHELAVRGLETVTFNGFPYEAFQAPVVKYAVYYPDWTDERRLRYTLDLATVLSELLPDDAARGSISTLPLAWRTPWDDARRDAARANLDALATGLRGLPRTIRVALEPEPGCLIETTTDAITHLAPSQDRRNFPESAQIYTVDPHNFPEDAPIMNSAHAGEGGAGGEGGWAERGTGWSGVDTDYIGVCVDLAHLACAWEEPASAIDGLLAAGLPVVKAQISAPLEVTELAQATDYVEQRFLHQARSKPGAKFDDLPEALAAQEDGPWRVHFHTPIHTAPAQPLNAGIEALVKNGVDHLEVETYTWNVLPGRPMTDADLVHGIAAEMKYLMGRVS
jgi:hypothetical protein